MRLRSRLAVYLSPLTENEPISDGALIKSLVPPDSPNPAPLYLKRVSTSLLVHGVAGSECFIHPAPSGDERAGRDSGARLTRFLDQKHPSSLIVDVRHNTGGDGRLLPPLRRTFVSVEASKPNAQIYIISGRATFSARSSSRKLSIALH